LLEVSSTRVWWTFVTSGPIAANLWLQENRVLWATPSGRHSLWIPLSKDHCSCIDWSLGWILLCLMQIGFSCYDRISVEMIPNSFMHWSLRLVILGSVQIIFIHNTRSIEIVILISVADVVHEWFVQFGLISSVPSDSRPRLLWNEFAFGELCWFRSLSLPQSTI
jgi:hypothetical protein